MAADDDGACAVVEVVSAATGEGLCSFLLPLQSRVLEVKRRVQAARGTGVFQQRLLGPAAQLLEDGEALAPLAAASAPEPIVLALVTLAHVDTDDLSTRQLLDAAERGHVHELRRLLGLPIHPDQAELEGMMTLEECHTALMLAASRGHLDATQLLCDAGANKDHAKHQGATAFVVASVTGQVEVVRVLCEAGANKDHANHQGATALVRASGTGQVEVLRVLCDAGADKDMARCDGVTALAVASVNGQVEVLRVLCDAGADIARHEFTALDMASGQVEVLHVLCEAGAIG